MRLLKTLYGPRRGDERREGRGHRAFIYSSACLTFNHGSFRRTQLTDRRHGQRHSVRGHLERSPSAAACVTHGACSLRRSPALDALFAHSCAKRRLPRQSSFLYTAYYIAVHYVLSTEARPSLPALFRALVPHHCKFLHQPAHCHFRAHTYRSPRLSEQNLDASESGAYTEPVSVT